MATPPSAWANSLTPLRISGACGLLPAGIDRATATLATPAGRIEVTQQRNGSHIAIDLRMAVPVTIGDRQYSPGARTITTD